MIQTITTFFTSGSGAPAVGLTPTIRVLDVDTVTLVTASVMQEVGDGWYSFEFLQYDFSGSYAIRTDGGTGSLDSRFTFAGNESFVDDIWGVQREDHKLLGSTGEGLRDIFDIEKGDWRITSGGDLILTRSGSGEVIATFDLRKLDGSDLTDPVNEDPFRRSRID